MSSNTCYNCSSTIEPNSASCANCGAVFDNSPRRHSKQGDAARQALGHNRAPKKVNLRLFLTEIGMSQYIVPFEEQEIAGEILLTLSEADLEKLGVAKLGHRKTIIAAINKHKPKPRRHRQPRRSVSYAEDNNFDSRKTDNLQTRGWIGAFLFPIIGLIIGIILLTKNRVGVGIAQVLVSLFMWDFWVGFWPAFYAAL